MSFHSTSGVDAYLDPKLPPFGFAVDVGANIDSGYSNSLHFEEKLWIVMCVEPNPLLLPYGRQYRRLWRQIACGSKDEEEVKFVSVGNFPYLSWSGLHTDKVLPQFPGTETKEFMVKMRTLNRVLDEAGFPRLDFLTIDAEDHDLEVLKGIDLSVWKPAWISAESWESETPITPYLQERGYRFDRRIQVDNLYERVQP